LVKRQLANANHCYKRATCDWLLHIDIDEYVIRETLIQAHLDSLGPEVISVPLMNAERVFWRGKPGKSVLEGVYRKRFNSEKDLRERLIYGRAAQLLTHGFSGYYIGKCFTRTGVNARIDVHRTALPADHDASQISRVFKRVGLIHFDAMTEQIWHGKLRRKLSKHTNRIGYTSGRLRQLDYVQDRLNSALDIKPIFEKLCSIGWFQYWALRFSLKILRVNFDVTPALRAEFPDIEVDLSPEGVDRAYAQLEQRSAAQAV